MKRTQREQGKVKPKKKAVNRTKGKRRNPSAGLAAGLAGDDVTALLGNSAKYLISASAFSGLTFAESVLVSSLIGPAVALLRKVTTQKNINTAAENIMDSWDSSEDFHGAD